MAGFDITEDIPLAIAARHVASSYGSSGFQADVTIGGIPFRYAIDANTPYARQTNDYKRQQIDTSTEPGEQSLSQWWVRDQDSWHYGAGVTYYEPGSDVSTKYRYKSSVGVDVWTKGQASLLKKTALLQSAVGACYAVGARVSSADVIFGVAGGTFFRHDGTTKTSYTGAPWTPSTEPAVAGKKVLVGGTGGVMIGDASGSTLASLYTDAALIRPWWVKSRVIMSKGAALYEGTLTGGVAVSTLTPIWTHPDADFTWTSVVDAPDCILAAGYGNAGGFVYAFNLVTSGTAGTSPTLDQAVQVAELPVGEEVHSLKVYLGAYVVLGTSRGVRVGQVGQNGRLQYGPLSISTTQPVRSLSSRGSYVYAAIEADIDGFSGCARIDLGAVIKIPTGNGFTSDSGAYAWAYDAQAHVTGAVYNVTFLGNSDRVVLAVNTKGIFLQSASSYEATGYILSGRVRYATAENKTFVLAKVRSSISSDATVALASIDSAGTETSVFTYTASLADDQDISLGAVAENPQTYISIRLILNASADLATSPVLENYQIKATPQPTIQRNIQLPLALADSERDALGNKAGYLGSAYIRLAALEAMENDNSVVQVVDRTNGESFSGQITKVQFIRKTPPARNEKNFGGLLVVTVLKL